MEFLLIGAVTSVLFIVISTLATVSTYRVNPVFLIPLLWAPYMFRRKLNLHPLHFALYAIAFLLHDLGAFGFYRRGFFGLSYDIYVHYFFAIPVSLIFYRALRHNLPLGPVAAGIGTLLIMMGFGALHEIMEYCTYLLLGEEKGMLKPSTSYFFDTQRDLTNNLLGTLTALTCIALHRWISASREPEPAGISEPERV